MVRAIWAYLVAAAGTFVVGCVAATQHVVGAYTQMGGTLSLLERLGWTLRDLGGMLVGILYPGFILAALAIAFAVAGLIARGLPGLRTVGFVLAGGVAMLVLHLVAKEAAGNINPIAATRTITGLSLQVIAGAVGGALFVLMKPRAQSTKAAAAD